MSKVRAEKDLSAKELVKIARDNHIWLNAFACINPSDAFKIDVADMILEKLNTTDLRATKLSDGKEPVSNVVYIRINKS